MDQFEPLDVGDKVKHPKFGTGTVMQRFGENENQKVIVKFGAEFGEKKLVTKIANMKRISERPTLPAAPAAPGTFPGAVPGAGAVAGIPVTKVPPPREVLAVDEAEEEEDDDDLLLDDDEDADDDVLDEDEGETGAEEAEEE